MDARSLLGLLVVASCWSGGRAPAPVVPATTIVAPRPVVAEGPKPCLTTTPFTVTTLNLTRSRGDLCGAFNRVAGGLRLQSTAASSGFELHITLSKLQRSSTRVACEITIDVHQRATSIGLLSSGASFDASSGNPARECVDHVLRDLMRTNVGPLLLHRP